MIEIFSPPQSPVRVVAALHRLPELPQLALQADQPPLLSSQAGQLALQELQPAGEDGPGVLLPLAAQLVHQAGEVLQVEVDLAGAGGAETDVPVLAGHQHQPARLGDNSRAGREAVMTNNPLAEIKGN